jgi:hypothetical protein
VSRIESAPSDESPLAVAVRFSRHSKSKITTLALGWVEDSVVRSDNQTSELPDHFGGAHLFRLSSDGWTTFFVPDSLMQDQPDQLTLPMGNGSDGLLVSET